MVFYALTLNNVHNGVVTTWNHKSLCCLDILFPTLKMVRWAERMSDWDEIIFCVTDVTELLMLIWYTAVDVDRSLTSWDKISGNLN